MKGSHRVIVESKKVKYDFVLKRNITILTGDSGSGKTVLIDLIRDYNRYERTVEFFFLVTVNVRQLIMKIGKDRLRKHQETLYLSMKEIVF